MEWTVLRRLDGLLQGDFKTLFRGFGLDLAELREYQLHDDVRYIDWNVTARLQTPYVRQYNEDREITAWFLLDISPSVDFGSEDRTKRDVLIDFAGLLATILTRHGNRVGALFYGQKVERVIDAAGGRSQVLHLIDLLRKSSPAPGATETNLEELFRAALNVIKRKAVIFVISDFFSTPGWENPLGHLALRHEVLAVRIIDPFEVEFPDLGLMVMADAESGEQLLVDSHDPSFRRRFLEASREREETIRNAFTRAGVDALELSTRDDLVESIIRYITLRKQLSRISAGSSANQEVQV